MKLSLTAMPKNECGCATEGICTCGKEICPDCKKCLDCCVCEKVPAPRNLFKMAVTSPNTRQLPTMPDVIFVIVEEHNSPKRFIVDGALAGMTRDFFSVLPENLVFPEDKPRKEPSFISYAPRSISETRKAGKKVRGKYHGQR